jgi:hypothetical protein
MNRLVSFCLIALLWATGALSQSGGTIIGAVVDSNGEAVANAQVQATDKTTKTVYKTAGSDKYDRGPRRLRGCRMRPTRSRSRFAVLPGILPAKADA